MSKNKISKISLKSVCGTIGELTKATELMLVIGLVKKWRMVEGDLGSHIVLSGDFFARDLRGKKEYTANKAILPDEIARLAADEHEWCEPGSQVYFAYIISAKPAKTMAGMTLTYFAVAKPQLFLPLDVLLDEFSPGSTKRSKKKATKKVKTKPSKTSKKKTKKTSSASKKKTSNKTVKKPKQPAQLELVDDNYGGEKHL